MWVLPAIVVTADNALRCWGYGENGNLGNGSTDSIGDELSEMGVALSVMELGTSVAVKHVDFGLNHGCALFEDGQVKCWGDNSMGELGVEDQENRGDDAGEMGSSLPFVNLGTGRHVLSLCAGLHYNCAVLDDQTLKCWGANYNGQLGQETPRIAVIAVRRWAMSCPLFLWEPIFWWLRRLVATPSSVLEVLTEG